MNSPKIKKIDPSQIRYLPEEGEVVQTPEGEYAGSFAENEGTGCFHLGSDPLSGNRLRHRRKRCVP